MKYKNTKTKAVIDVPCKINGGDWIPLEKAVKEKSEEVKPVETENTKEQETEEVAAASNNSGSMDDVTKNEIMQELDSMGIKYDKNAKKAVLYKLMVGE